MCHFQAQNGLFVLNKIFLAQTIIITFIYLLAIFTVQNFKKFLQQIQSYEDVPIFGTKWSICPKQNFFLKIINIILNHPLASFIVQNLKTILPAAPELWGAQFLSPKWAIFQSENFIRKPVSFIHAYLHPKNQSQMLISEILAIKEYWNLNGREPFLANLRSRFFPNM